MSVHDSLTIGLADYCLRFTQSNLFVWENLILISTILYENTNLFIVFELIMGTFWNKINQWKYYNELMPQ